MNKLLKNKVSIIICSILILILSSVHTAYATSLTQSVSLNGSSQSLSIANGSQTGLGFTGNHTFEGWVYLNSAPTSGDQFAIFSKYDGGGANQRGYLYTYENIGGTTQINARISTNGTSATSGTLNLTIPVNTWTHLALVYSTSGTVDVIMNGVNQGTITSMPASIYSNTADVRIGYQPDVTTGYFPGKFSIVRAWDTLLSTSTINANKCTVFGSPQTNLKAEWSLDGVLTDASGNGNTLTNNGSASYAGDFPPCNISTSVAVKSATQTLTNYSTLQYDNALAISVDANKTYIIDGVIFASATTSSATPDIILGFEAPSGASIVAGANDSMISALNTASSRIVLSSYASVPIRIQGTLITSSSGTLQFKWAQSTANSAPTSVLKGSYLRLQEI